MKFFGLITARSGSKGIPGKNIIKLNDKTLIQIVAEALVNSGSVSQSLISTDSQVYGTIASHCGVAFPWIRPQSLAIDKAAVNDVIRHVITTEQLVRKGFTHIVLLQPSSPLTLETDIQAAVKLILGGKYDSVVSATKFEDKSLNYIFDNDRGYCRWIQKQSRAFGNRQEVSLLYKRCGNVYCFNINKFIKLNTLACDRCGFIEIPQERSVCLDELKDIQELKMFGDVTYEG